MNTFYVFLYLIALLLVGSNNGLSSSAASTANFYKDFHLIKEYAQDHVQTSRNGKTRNLTLDKKSGAGFISNNQFLFGRFEMKMKLIAGKPAAGTVVAFYLTSSYYNEAYHDEIDFEFLGNVAKKPYVLQTNVFINGIGNREEKIKLWFDPTEGYHNYSILWNNNLIVWMVESRVIRAFVHKQNKPYPNGLHMSLVTTIWDGSSWATNHGKNPIDWRKAPFEASAKDAKMDACIITKWNNQGTCASTNYWWNQKEFSSLTPAQKHDIIWVRKYCHYE